MNTTEEIKGIKSRPSAKNYFIAFYEICIEPLMVLSFIAFALAAVLTVMAMLVSPPIAIVYIITGGFIIGIPAVLSLIVHACQTFYSKAVEVSERE